MSYSRKLQRFTKLNYFSNNPALREVQSGIGMDLAVGADFFLVMRKWRMSRRMSRNRNCLM